MANHQEKQKPAEPQKNDRKNGSKGFAGKAALVSTLTETATGEASMLSSNFSRLPDQLLGGLTSERELSDQIGAPVRIISNRELGASIGLDAADRFIEEAENGESKRS